MEREKYGEKKDRNIKEKVFMILKLFLKQSKKEKKTHGYLLLMAPPIC